MRGDGDFYAAYVLNHILGGGSFTSRLYDEIREKRGLVYSVGTALYPFDHSALILGSAGTANEHTYQTLSLIKEEWGKMAINGVRQKELDDAKTYLTGSFPLRFSSSSQIASMLVGMQTLLLQIPKGSGVKNAVSRPIVAVKVGMDSPEIKKKAEHWLQNREENSKLLLIKLGDESKKE